MATAPHAAFPERTYRSMRPSDIDEVFELVQLAFGDAWPGFPISVSRREHLEWKVRYPDPDLCDVLEIDGRVVGYQGGREWDVLVQGQRHRGGFLGDYCIHPDYQERGLTSPWFDWLEERRETVPGTIGLGEDSTHPRLMRRSQRLDNRDLIANKVDRLTLHFDVMALARLGTGEPGRVTPRSLLRAARAVALIAVGRARWRRPSTPLPELELRTVESFDEQADRLWESAKGVFEYARVRDREHLNWRYCDARAGIYRVRAAERRGELLGYMVTGAIGRAAQVVDHLVVPGRDDVLRALVEDAVAHAPSTGDQSLTVLMPWSHPYRETFLRQGFIKLHRVDPFGFRRRDDSPVSFLATDPRGRIHIAAGDYDHI